MIAEIPPEIAADYAALHTLPDGRICGVHRLLYHWTVHVDVHAFGYEDRWCFADGNEATQALLSWDGEGDMPGRWHKHPKTGRRQDPDTGEIWHESDSRG